MAFIAEGLAEIGEGLAAGVEELGAGLVKAGEEAGFEAESAGSALGKIGKKIKDKKKPTWSPNDIDYSNASSTLKEKLNREQSKNNENSTATGNPGGWSDEMINHINAQKEKRQNQSSSSSTSDNDNDTEQRVFRIFREISHLGEQFKRFEQNSGKETSSIVEAINRNTDAVKNSAFMIKDKLDEVNTDIQEIINIVTNLSNRQEAAEQKAEADAVRREERNSNEEELENENNKDENFNPEDHNSHGNFFSDMSGKEKLGFLGKMGLGIVAADIIRRAFPELYKDLPEKLGIWLSDATTKIIDKVENKLGINNQRDKTLTDKIDSILETWGNRDAKPGEERGFSRSTDVTDKDLADLEASHRDKYNADQVKRFGGSDPGSIGNLTEGQKKFNQNIINNNGVDLHSSSDPRGIRNNNPTNLNFANQNGATKESGIDGRFAVFKNMEDGIAAAAHQIEIYSSRGINTVRGIITKWAPESDHNNTSEYIRQVSKKLGVSPDDKIDIHDRNVMFQLLDAITHVEVGKGRVTDEQIQRGISQAFRSNQEKYQSDAIPFPKGKTSSPTSSPTADATPLRSGQKKFIQKLNDSDNNVSQTEGEPFNPMNVKSTSALDGSGVKLLKQSETQANKSNIIIAPQTVNNVVAGGGGSSGGPRAIGYTGGLPSSSMPSSVIVELA
jgi:hypothetical protein